jgi:hypothetical protein
VIFRRIRILTPHDLELMERDREAVRRGLSGLAKLFFSLVILLGIAILALCIWAYPKI